MSTIEVVCAAVDSLCGVSPEAAIALRQRLNETVDQLDALRKEHAELEVKFETQSKELTIAKSDRTLPFLYIEHARYLWLHPSQFGPQRSA